MYVNEHGRLNTQTVRHKLVHIISQRPFGRMDNLEDTNIYLCYACCIFFKKIFDFDDTLTATNILFGVISHNLSFTFDHPIICKA